VDVSCSMCTPRRLAIVQSFRAHHFSLSFFRSTSPPTHPTPTRSEVLDTSKAERSDKKSHARLWKRFVLSLRFHFNDFLRLSRSILTPTLARLPFLSSRLERKRAIKAFLRSKVASLRRCRKES